MILSLLSVLAQTPEVVADPLIPQWLQITLTVVASLGGLIGTGLLWLKKNFGPELQAWVKGKTDNEALLAGARAFDKLWSIVTNAVVAAEQTLKKEVLKAKAPDSPGVAKITASEGDVIKAAVKKSVIDSAGGWGALAELVGAAFNGGGTAEDPQVHAVVDNAIEAALAKTKNQVGK